MKRFVFRLLTVVTVIAVILPVGGLAASQGVVGPESGDANGQWVYLPLVGKNASFLSPIIPETTNVLPPETTNLTSVSPDGVTYTFSGMTPELAAVGPGEIIVSAPTGLAPDGFLRKVTAVNTGGGQVIVQTQAATLEDAIQQGQIHLSRHLTPADIEAVSALQGVALVRPTGVMLEDSFFFEIKDVVLYDQDGNHGTTSDQIKANGNLELAPGFDFDLIVKDWALQKLDFVFDVEENVELEFQIEVELVDVELKWKIAQLHLGTIVVFVGLVPVVFTIESPEKRVAQTRVFLRKDYNVAQEPSGPHLTL